MIATLATAIGGCYVPLRAMLNSRAKDKKRQAATILQDAKECDAALKLHLENKIHEIDSKLISLKENVDKDLSHLKETYQSEIKFLGDKIAELRKEVHDQHGQLVQLLTKMIGKD